MKNKQISENFFLKEFDFVNPDTKLLSVLERLRKKTKDSILITSGPRTIEDHIRIYKEKEERNQLNGKKWHECIPWGSRHLPKFECGLRASDIKCVKSRRENEIIDYYTGEEILDFLKLVSNELDIFLGIGVGEFYCHIDIDREENVVWYY